MYGYNRFCSFAQNPSRRLDAFPISASFDAPKCAPVGKCGVSDAHGCAYHAVTSLCCIAVDQSSICVIGTPTN